MTGKYERVRDYFVGPKGVFLIKHMNKEKGNGFNICNISLWNKWNINILLYFEYLKMC